MSDPSDEAAVPAIAPAEPKMPDPSGEIFVVVKEVKYPLRPSFRFLRRIEDATDKGVTEIIQAFADGRVRVGHLALILYHGIMEGGNRPPSVEVLGEWLCQDNVAQVLVPVTRLMLGALTAKSKP